MNIYFFICFDVLFSFRCFGGVFFFFFKVSFVSFSPFFFSVLFCFC